MIGATSRFENREFVHQLRDRDNGAFAMGFSMREALSELQQNDRVDECQLRPAEEQRNFQVAGVGLASECRTGLSVDYQIQEEFR